MDELMFEVESVSDSVALHAHQNRKLL